MPKASRLRFKGNATGSVVTRDVPPYAIWAGAPAREIRKRFDDKTVRALLDLQWWDWPEQRLTALGDAFHTPAELLTRVQDG